MTNYKNIKLNPLPDREIEIIGTITAEKMSLMREKALAKIKASMEIDGFRKGNAPDTIVAQKVGEMAILEEAAEIALSEEYPNILEEHKIDAIGRPEISITKIAIGNDLEFKAKTALMPDVKLADYKSASSADSPKRRETIQVTEQEVDDVIKNIQQNLAHQKLHSESGGDDSNHNHREITDADLQEVNDEFAKMIGSFSARGGSASGGKDINTVNDLKKLIKENIFREKEIKEKDKKRTEILEEIMKESKIELPKIIIEGEMEKMLAQFKDNIGKSDISYEEYLKHIKKTGEDLRVEWKDTAVKRAKSQIILNTIAKEEGVAPKEEDIKKEMENILANHKDADRFRVRMYVETFLTNELVFQFLEKN